MLLMFRHCLRLTLDRFLVIIYKTDKKGAYGYG